MPSPKDKKMTIKDLLCDKEMCDRLLSHGIWISDRVGTLTKSQALALIGQSLFEKFVNEFSKVWEELFPDCRIKDFEATEEDWKRWLGDDYHAIRDCKEVDKNGK